jgi:hypothetical protein
MKFYKRELSQFFWTRPWAVPLAGVSMLLVLPVLMPVLIILALHKEILALAKDYVHEALQAIRFTGFKDE